MKRKIFTLFCYFVRIIILSIFFIMINSIVYAQDDGTNGTNTDITSYNDYYEVVLPDITFNINDISIKYKTDVSIFTPPKDPFLASILSFIWMGLGQIYVGEKPVSSTIFISAEAFFIVSGISAFFVLQSKYSTYDDPIMKWEEFNGEDKVLIITFILGYVALKIYNILDAYNETVKYNRKYFSPVSEKENDSTFDIDIIICFSSIGINLKF